MAAHLRVVAEAETPTAPAPKKRRRAAAKKPAPETARDRKNRLARERRAAKKLAEQKAAEVVAEDPEPAAPVRLTLAEAIEQDDYEQILIAQRREAVADLPRVNGPAKAALHRQIASLSKEIAGLVAAKTEGTDIGDATETPDEDFDPDA